MKTTIRKIGNSAGAILPAAILKKVHLSEGDIVEITEDGKRIVIEPATLRPRYTLVELLSQCNPRAPLSDELTVWDAVQPVGRELL